MKRPVCQCDIGFLLPDVCDFRSSVCRQREKCMVGKYVIRFQVRSGLITRNTCKFPLPATS